MECLEKDNAITLENSVKEITEQKIKLDELEQEKREFEKVCSAHLYCFCYHKGNGRSEMETRTKL